MLLIFDWDGTLQNTIEKIVICMQKSAAEQGIECPSKEAVRDVIGLSLNGAMDKLFGDTLNDDQRKKLQKIYSRIYNEEDQTPTPFFENAFQLLQELKSNGHMLAVATGKRRQGLDRILDKHNLHDQFDITRCADETASKPDPLMLHEILEKTDTPKEHAIMIGDSYYDMLMAQKADVSAIGVTHGVHKAEKLKEGGASETVNNLKELGHALLAKA